MEHNVHHFSMIDVKDTLQCFILFSIQLKVKYSYWLGFFSSLFVFAFVLTFFSSYYQLACLYKQIKYLQCEPAAY